MTETFQLRPNVSYTDMLISIIVAAHTWFWSFTFLFPLLFCLKISSACRKKFFSLIFPIICSSSGNHFGAFRKKAFERLPTESTRNIKVLEIGVGPGANFDYYSSNYELTLLDMNENFESNIRKKLKDYPHLKVEKIVFAMAEDMKGVPNSEYDLVVCTHLLCSVRDVAAVLKEVSRVLKPDGKFLYLEHIGYPSTMVAYWIQTFLNPLWKIYFNGCNINRFIHNRIGNHFTHNSYQIFYVSFMPFFLKPHVIGVASHPKVGKLAKKM